jgi:vacuolar-type H+-ATPase subunit E/Vma4
LGIDELRTAIEAEGRARVAAVLHDASEQAARIGRETQASADLHRRDALARAEAELRCDARMRVAKAERAARSRVLEARAGLLDRVFELARDALPAALEAPGARERLIAHAEPAMAHMPEGPVVVTASSDLSTALEATLGGREGVRVESDGELPAGFRVSSADGALVVDATLEKLLDLRRPELAIQVLRRLEERALP